MGSTLEEIAEKYNKKLSKKISKAVVNVLRSKELKKAIIDEVSAIDDVGRREAGHIANEVTKATEELLKQDPKEVKAIAKEENKNTEIVRTGPANSTCVVAKFDGSKQGVKIDRHTLILSEKMPQ